MFVRSAISIVLMSLIAACVRAPVKGNAVSLSSKLVVGASGVFYGSHFVLRDTATLQSFHSQTLSIAKQSYTTAYVPSGEYEVVYMGSDIGDYIVNEDIRKHFGVISIEEGGCYFLGNYRGKVRAGFNRPIVYKLVDSKPSDGLLRMLRRRGVIEAHQKVLAVAPVTSDSLVIDL